MSTHQATSLTILSPSAHEPAVTAKYGLVLNTKLTAFQKRNLELLESSNFADCEIVLDTRSWKVHKFIVCSRSGFIHKALTGPWTEAETRKVTLDTSVFQEEDVEFILRWLYTGGKVFSLREKPGPETPVFVPCVRVYEQADFLSIPELRNSAARAVREYRALVKKTKAASVFETPMDVSASVLGDDWVSALKLLYNHNADVTSDPMAKAMMAYCLEDKDDRESAKKSAEFKALLREEPKLATDWALGLIEKDCSLA